jgi:hypothetical protein
MAILGGGVGDDGWSLTTLRSFGFLPYFFFVRVCVCVLFSFVEGRGVSPFLSLDTILLVIAFFFCLAWGWFCCSSSLFSLLVTIYFYSPLYFTLQIRDTAFASETSY